MRNEQDYIALLLLLPHEKQNIVAKHLINIKHLLKKTGSEKDLLVLSVNHPQLFNLLWNLLSIEQHIAAASPDKRGCTMLHCTANNDEVF